MQSAKKVVWALVFVAMTAWRADAQTTFNAAPATLGAIPDAFGIGVSLYPMDVTFTVTGMPRVAAVSVNMNITHTKVGQMIAVLIAPDGTQHAIFGRAGAVTDNSTTPGSAWGGYDGDLIGAYSFSDAAAGDWWTAAGAGATVATGSYRTSQIGGSGSTGATTTMNPVFAGVVGNGTWILRLTDFSYTQTGSISAASIDLTPLSLSGATDSYSTAYRTARVVAAPGVLGNDSTNGSTLTASLVAGPAHGALTLNGDGSFTYTPAAGYHGADSFTYAPTVGAAAGATTTVNLTVTPPTTSGSGDSYTTAYRTPLSVTAPGVLGNDSTGIGSLTAVLGATTAHGTLVLGADGSVLYTPAAGYVGSDSFLYQPAVDGIAAPAVLVTLTVSAPVMTANTDSFTTAYRAPVTVAAPGVLGNDTVDVGTLTAVLDGGPSNGTLSLNANGGFTYTSSAGFYGTDGFTYHTVVDGIAGPAAQVHIAVAAPVMTGTSDSYTAAFQTPLTVPAPGVLANDTTNNGTLQMGAIGQPAHGAVTSTIAGGFTYYPDAGYVGADSFTYQLAADGVAGPPVLVSLTVSAPTDAQPPAGLVTADISGGIATLRWQPPAVGPAPTAYVVEAGMGPNQVLGDITVSAAYPVLRLPVPPGVFYLRVRAQAGASISGPSNELRLVVGGAEAPSAPAALTALIDGTTLSLGWRNTFGGGEPLGVVVDVTGAATGAAPLPLGESFSVANVPPGVYTLAVRAANATGVSAAAAPVTVTVPSLCTGAPSMPANFLAFVTNGQLGLLWDPPSTGAAPQGYLLTVSGGWSGSVSVTSRFTVVPVPAGTYTFSVQAVNACGSSAATPMQTVTIP